MPLLDVLKRRFASWQVLLFTYDLPWFEMAKFHLPEDKWVSMRLFARAHDDGWEMPVLKSDAPYLERAWSQIRDGDYKGAAVYLRTAWEQVMRDFCDARRKEIPYKSDMRDYQADDFWPVVEQHEFKTKHRLVDRALADQIKICRSFVLNPLCHSDPQQPTQDETLRAYTAVHQLKALLDADVQVAKKAKQLGTRGKAKATDYALQLANFLLNSTPPNLIDAAYCLRSAFDQALSDYCYGKKFDFTVKSQQRITTKMLWDTATEGATGLRATQATFVSAIERHADFMLRDSPDRNVIETKTAADLQLLRDALIGSSKPEDPKCVLRDW